MSVLESKQYQQEIDRRAKNARETLSFEKDFSFEVNDSLFHIWLPENVMEQKKAIELMTLTTTGVDAEKEFMEFILRYTEKNKSHITLMDLDMVEFDMLEAMYQHILLYPLSIWSQAMLDKAITKTLGLKQD